MTEAQTQILNEIDSVLLTLEDEMSTLKTEHQKVRSGNKSAVKRARKSLKTIATTAKTLRAQYQASKTA